MQRILVDEKSLHKPLKAWFIYFHMVLHGPSINKSIHFSSSQSILLTRSSSSNVELHRRPGGVASAIQLELEYAIPPPRPSVLSSPSQKIRMAMSRKSKELSEIRWCQKQTDFLCCFKLLRTNQIFDGGGAFQLPRVIEGGVGVNDSR